MIHVRVLTVADLHQSSSLYYDLEVACALHEPDALVLVGDCLEAIDSQRKCFTPRDCAQHLNHLPVRHVVFVRGNHEHVNWADFVSAWPIHRRPLMSLHCDAINIGPLVIVGFPCDVGDERTWVKHLQNLPTQEPRKRFEHFGRKGWLPELMGRLGPAGRTLWCMHEPPVSKCIGKAGTSNPEWFKHVKKFSPLLTVSGHDHGAPLQSGAWGCRLNRTLCVNVGQKPGALHYSLIDCHFPSPEPSVPTQLSIETFPWGQKARIL